MTGLKKGKSVVVAQGRGRTSCRPGPARLETDRIVMRPRGMGARSRGSRSVPPRRPAGPTPTAKIRSGPPLVSSSTTAKSSFTSKANAWSSCSLGDEQPYPLASSPVTLRLLALRRRTPSGELGRLSYRRRIRGSSWERRSRDVSRSGQRATRGRLRVRPERAGAEGGRWHDDVDFHVEKAVTSRCRPT